MSLEQTKKLLETHKIVPNKLLGQNFMVAPSLFPKLCIYADLGKSDVVLDAGAGFGWLTCFLADKCKAVVAVEKDPKVAQVLCQHTLGLDNVKIVIGDVLKVPLPFFNKAIAIPPYYLSSDLIVWLLQRKVESSVLIVQKEFAKRLVASVGSEEYGWLTVVAAKQVHAELLDTVPKDKFYPQPQVDSVVIRLKLWLNPPFEVNNPIFFTQMVKWLFTERNKKIAKSLPPFLRTNLKLSKLDAEKLALDVPFHDRRARELTPQNFGVIANALPNEENTV